VGKNSLATCGAIKERRTAFSAPNKELSAKPKQQSQINCPARAKSPLTGESPIQVSCELAPHGFGVDRAIGNGPEHVAGKPAGVRCGSINEFRPYPFSTKTRGPQSCSFLIDARNCRLSSTASTTATAAARLASGCFRPTCGRSRAAPRFTWCRRGGSFSRHLLSRHCLVC